MTVGIPSTGTTTISNVFQDGTGGGPLSLVYVGTGTFTRANHNSYTGTTTVNGGTLSLSTLVNSGSPSPIGAATNAPGNLVLEGGATLLYTGTTTSTDHGFTLGSGGGTIDVANSGTTLTVGGNVANGANPLTFTGPGNAVFAGVLTGGTGTLTKGIASTDTGVVTFTASQALQTGNISVNDGTLGISTTTLSSSRILTIAAGANVNSSGTLYLTANTSSTYNAVAGGGTLNLTSTTNGPTSPDIYFDFNDADGSTANWGTAISANVNLGSAQRYLFGKTNHSGFGVYGLSADCVFTGSISGSGGLTFIAQDTFVSSSSPMEVPFVLAGANTFTGMLEIQRGSVYLDNATALTQGNVLLLDPTSGPINGGAAGPYNARLFLNGFNAVVSNLSSSGSGNAAIANGNRTNPPTSGIAAATLLVNLTTNETFGGSISDALLEYSSTGSGTLGGLSLDVTGSGTLTMSGTSTNTGVTTASTAAVISYPGLGNLPSAGPLALDGGTLRYTGPSGSTGTSAYVVAVTGNGGSLDASGTGPITLGSAGTVLFTGSGATTLTLTGTNTGANVLGAVLADGSGPTSIVKTGTGAWDLTGADTDTGTTQVNAGELLVDGSLTSAVTVASGATLGGAATATSGSGTITANVVVNGTLTSGDSPTTTGQLTVGNLSFGSGAAVNVALNGTTAGTSYDQIIGSGTINLTGATLNVSTLSGLVPTVGNTFDILSNTGGSAITGTFTGLAEGATFTASGQQFKITYQGGTSGHDVVLTEMTANPAFTSANNATFAAGTGGTFTVHAVSSPTPTLAETGTPPTGVSFNASTGLLTVATTTATGVYNLVFTASNGGTPTSQNFTLTVTSPPAITSANKAAFVVGTGGTFTVTATGVPTPTLAETATLPSGVSFTPSTGVLSVSTTAANGVYNLTFTATNGVGTAASQNFTLTVGTAPAITSANNAAFSAGTGGTFTVTATGSPTPTLAETATLPSAVTFNATTGVLTVATTAAGGVYSLTFTASNGVGTVASQSFTLTVIAGTASVFSGSPQTTMVTTAFGSALVAIVKDSNNNPLSGVTVTFTAPSSGPSGTFSGSLTTITGTTNASGQVSEPFTANSVAGSYNVTAAVAGQVTPASFSLTNTPGAPASATVVSGSSQSGTVNSALASPLKVIVKDSSGNPIPGVNVTFVAPGSGPGGSFSNGFAGISGVTDSSGQLSESFTANTLAGTYTVEAFVNGVSTPASFSLTNTAGAAASIVVTSGSNQSALVSSTFASPLVATVKDAYGNLVPNVTVTFAGPGSGASVTFPSGATATTGSNGQASVAVAANGVAGSYSVTASTSGVGTPASFSLTNTPNDLFVTSFTQTPSGFTVAFSKPFVDSSTSPLHLYDAASAGYGPAEVTLVGQNSGAITGSLLVNSSNTGFTFIKTDPTYGGSTAGLLPADSYTVTLVSGSNALRDTSNVPLDGQDNGGSANYVTTFTVTASSAVVVSVPDFARGPDSAHAINLPNNSTNGIPIALSNGAGVTSGTLTLQYNASLLNVTGATTTLSGATFTLDAASTPGNAILDFSSSTALGSGAVILGSLQATVPSGAAYKSKALLHWSSTVLMAGTTPLTTVGDDGVQVVAFLGNTTGSGTYTSADSVLLTRATSGVDSGFAAFPVVDPVILGDIAGAGIGKTSGTDKLTSADATLLNRYLNGTTVAQMPTYPGAPSNNPTGPDPVLSLPSQVQIGPGSTVTVPVNIDDPHPAGSTGMTEATLALTYDPKVLQVLPGSIRLGTVPAAGTDWTLQSAVNATTGQIGITLFSAFPISSSTSGSLVTISFHEVPGTNASATTVSLVSAVDPTGAGPIATAVYDNQGPYTLSLPEAGSGASMVEKVLLTGSPLESAAGNLNPTLDSSISASRILQGTPSNQSGSGAIPTETAVWSLETLDWKNRGAAPGWLPVASPLTATGDDTRANDQVFEDGASVPARTAARRTMGGAACPGPSGIPENVRKWMR